MADDGYGSRENLRRRSGPQSVASDTPAAAGFYQPGQPIGFIRARGSPYEKKYFSRKLGYCCLFLAPGVLLVTLAITLLPVLYAVANHALHTAVLHVYESNITSPGNTSFPLTLEGQTKKVGIFPAHLFFREPVQVYWVLPPNPGQVASPETLTEVNLGQFRLDYIGAAAGHARIKQATNFEINDVDGFGEFAKFLISQPEFTWKLNCSSVHAEAFSFLPTYKNLVFNKHIIIKGFNNFEDVEILDFQLPGDDPAGGISLSVTTSLVNPSPFGVQLGTLNLGLYYQGMFLGPATTSNLNVSAGRNVITLNGRLVPHTDNATELELLGQLFTGYINGETLPTQARGVSVQQANGDNVGWLSQGITALELQVPLKAPAPINPIKSISIGSLALIYTPETAYSPTAFSSALGATLGLPFGFTLSIVNTATTFTILFEGAQVATINSAYSNTTTTLQLVSAGQTAGTLDLTLAPSQLTLANNTQAARTELEDFQKYFTFSSGTEIRLQGAAKAITDTPLGRVVLDGIIFDVDSGLLGLQGLTAYPTLITSVDVTGGSSDGILLSVGTTLVNPSNLNLTVGDSGFQLVNNGDVVGTVTIPGLDLMTGRNDVNATSVFDANASPNGLDTLNRFISGLDTQLGINGYEGSTTVSSLLPALSSLRLNATLPGLRSTLVRSANLTVLTTTGYTNNIANSTVFLANPFTSPLTITRIRSNVTSHGIFVASIDTPLEFTAQGRATTQSPPVQLGLNLYPPDIFALVRALAIESGQDPAYIDGVVQLGGYSLTPTTSANSRRSLAAGPSEASFEKRNELADAMMDGGNSVETLAEVADWAERDESDSLEEAGTLKKRANLYTGFDLPTYISRAFSSATANLEIVSEASIGDYSTTLTFAQANVPLGTDVTLNRLLPVLASPIVQKIVDNSILNIDRVTILNPQQNSFQTALQGTITNSGPFDATIQFTNGLNVTWNGRLLGQIAMPNVSLAGDVGATLEILAEFVVADVGYLTEFTRFLLTEQSFVWNIAGDGLSVAALGIQVDNISISKNVILSAFNGLRNSVIINSFDLPSNDPAGGIRLTAATTIYNPSQVGVQLSRFGVGLDRNGSYIGPSAAQDEFVLQALAVTTLPLVGRLVPQTTDQGLAVLSEIFTRFVGNLNTGVNVLGDYAGPESVTWLNDGIKALNVEVSLPSQQFTVIRTISINQISLFFSVPSAYSPPTSSNDTQSQFFLPFAFPLDIQQVGGGFIAGYQGQDMAVLDIPLSPSITDVTARILTLMFSDVPFAVYGNQHPRFSQFLADTTAGTQVTFNLNGRANTKALTAAGLVTISDIPFDVDTNLLGLQNLNARPAIISNLDVFRGFPSYLQINVDAELFNPSHITIGTGDVTFDVYFQGRKIGTAIITGLVLVPGVNIVPTQVRYSPQGSANVRAGQTLLENYVQGIVSSTIIQGTYDTTPIESLKQALAGIALTGDIPPLRQLLITVARLSIPPNIAQTGIAQANFDLRNPFTASINLLKVKADASYQGIFLGEINQDLSSNPISAPGHTTITSRNLPFNFDLDPKNLIRFVQAAAATAGVDLGPLPPLFAQVLAQASTQTTISPYPDFNPPNCRSGNQFDVLGAILRTLQGLTTRLDIQSSVKLDEYFTNLNFVQQPVPTITDNTALYLLGPAGAPIVQNIVDQAILTVDIANVTCVTNTGFDVSLSGALLNTGPFDAYIEFPEPLTVTWQGRNIATLSLPPICAFANEGVPDLRTSGHLTITNLGAFTDFATFILANPSFQWTVSSPKVTVRALNIIYSNVILSKVINFQAFNGLPGVTTSNFDIYGETSNSLLIRTNAAIPSPASLGIQLDTANFEIFFMGTDIGPISSSNLFLAAKTTTNTVLQGMITAKSGRDLQNTGILFTNFLQGRTQILQTQGRSVVTQCNGNQPVNWLSTAFRTLTIDVSLPGQIYQIIFSITLSDLTVFVNGNPADSYVVPSSSNSTIATFANPFMFSLQPIQAAPHINLSYAGGNTAYLVLPLSNVQAGTSRGPSDFQALQLMWRRQNIVAQDQANFQAFFAQLTDTPRGTFDLKGNTDVVAKTVIGNIPIGGIPFNVTTTLAGINSFNGVTTLSDVMVSSGTPDFLFVPLKVTLENPSNLTVFTNFATLPVIYSGTYVGRAEIPVLGLIPGSNLVQSYFYYSPASHNDSTAQMLLTRYVQPSDSDETAQSSPLTIDGSAGILGRQNLTPYDSLRPALAGVKLQTTLQGIATRIVTEIRVYLTAQTLITGIPNLLGLPGAPLPVVEIELSAQNVLDTNLYIVALQTSAKVAGSQPRNANDPDARVSYTFPSPYEVPSRGTSNSPRVPNVVLPKGLARSLGVIGNNLDIYNNLPVRLGPSAGNSYNADGLQYNEYNIPTQYFIDAGGGIIPITIPITNLTDLIPLLQQAGVDVTQLLGGVLGNLLQGNVIGALDSAGKGLVCTLANLGSGLGLGILNPVRQQANCPGFSSSVTSTSTSTNPVASLSSALTSGAGAVTSALSSGAAQVTSAAASVSSEAAAAGSTAAAAASSGAAAASSAVANAGGAVSSVIGNLGGLGRRDEPLTVRAEPTHAPNFQRLW
ncbi:Protein of unknown function DUF3712 [Kalmanozyma brasiliensis GHG001]|uniref:Uncharacterized protein n=1 Tax=Kalmanozyma brasiliensis (strain GHG001) TaxID=1365824 RepID=V5F1G6_KALBG|nr:Protein of unknown function DUF3712 [Kalmanozyma brasiliensis GHG001]EST10168.1 Protein of unknown function DUF3712 [Kalmanozyma brasiliensis GHG001]